MYLPTKHMGTDPASLQLYRGVEKKKRTAYNMLLDEKSMPLMIYYTYDLRVSWNKSFLNELVRIKILRLNIEG